MMAVRNSPKSCEVCGSSAIQRDEVFAAGRLLLSQCDRCHHRWTQARPFPIAPQLALTRRVSVAEVAMAS